VPVLAEADAVHVGDTPADAVYLGDTLVWSAMPEPWGPAESMFDLTLPTLWYTDYTLGVKFTVATNGRISHIRNYNESGARLDVSLWSETGTLLAAGADTSGTRGWRDVPLSAPVPVSAGTVYVATAYLNGATYGYTANPLPPSLTPHLAPTIAVYAPGGGAGFPAYSDPGYNYHVDVVYQQGQAPSAPWTPATITGLGLWLEADAITGVADGGAVSWWPDASGKGHHATPVATPPTWQQAGMNGKPTVKFADSRMTIAGWGDALSGKSEYTLFQVLSQQGFGNYPIITTAPTYAAWQWITEFDSSLGVYWGHANGSYRMYDAQMVSAAPTLLTYSLALPGAWGPRFFKNGTGITDYFGSSYELSRPVPSVGADVLLGGYFDGSFPLDDHVAAMIWYDRFLVDSERVQVENYLKSKYGIA
jgi:hypothetical protein